MVLPGAGNEVLQLPHCHVSSMEISQRLPDFDDLYSFAFVRNPWDRLYSIYEYVRTNIASHEIIDNFYENGLNHFRDCSFKEWLIEKESWAGWDRNKQYLPEQKRQQLSFITNESGKINITYVARFENLEDEYKNICKQLKTLPRILPHKNRSRRCKDYRVNYDQEMIDFVCKRHTKDINEFGYEFK